MAISYFHHVTHPGSERKAFFFLTTLAWSCQSSGNGNLSPNCRWQSVEVPNHVGADLRDAVCRLSGFRKIHPASEMLFHQSEGRLRQEFDLFSSVGPLGRAWLRGAAGRCRSPGLAQSGVLRFCGNRQSKSWGKSPSWPGFRVRLKPCVECWSVIAYNHGGGIRS